MNKSIDKVQTIIQLVVGIMLGLGYVKFAMFSQFDFSELHIRANFEGSSLFFIICIFLFLLIYFATKYKVCAFAFLITTIAIYLFFFLLLLRGGIF